jgi:PilZ domain
MRRRKEPRHPVDTGAEIRLIDLAAKLEGRVVDVSMGGCRIRTNLPFPLGVFRRVEMQFRLDGLPFRLAGVTQAIYDPFNVGIRFLNVSERMRDQLGQLIEEIKEFRERNGKQSV